MMGVLIASAAAANDGIWIGKISDSSCAASHKAGPATYGQETLTDAECVEVCVEGGAKYVFVSGGTIYSIANQDNRDLRRNVGLTVQLAGEINGMTITVSKISPSHRKASTRK